MIIGPVKIITVEDAGPRSAEDFARHFSYKPMNRQTIEDAKFYLDRLEVADMIERTSDAGREDAKVVLRYVINLIDDHFNGRMDRFIRH